MTGTENFIRMDGPRVFRLAVTRLQEAGRGRADGHRHQPRPDPAADPAPGQSAHHRPFPRSTGLPKDRVYLNVDRYGNTSSASIPIAFDETLAEGRMREGDLVLLIAFGAGLTWASALVVSKGRSNLPKL